MKHLMLCLSALLCMGALSACGGDDADQQRLQAEQIAQAEADGRREARAEQRAKDAADEANKLRRQVDELRRAQARRDKSRGSTSPSPAPRTPAPTTTGSTSCGDGLSVNAVTTCPFARNVRDAYGESGGSPVLDVYSPATKQTYTMRCAGGLPTVCSGGNGAAVYIR